MNPVLQALNDLGCRSQIKVATAYHIYMELCEVQALWDVKYHYNGNLDLIYFTAKRSRTSKEAEIFVPHSATDDMKLGWIETVQNAVCGDELKRVTLAIKHQDSSVVYYSATQGMVPPDSPETARKKKQQNEKRYRNETELQRQRRELFEQAMCKTSSFEESTDEEL